MLVSDLILFLFISLTGEEIMRKVDGLPIPRTSQSSVKMIIKKGGDTRERKLIVYTEDDGKRRKSVMKFLEPQDVKDTAFLQISEKGDTAQFLYLPSLKKVRRIAGAQKKTSFMGSELTYEDMQRREVDDFEHKLVSEDDQYYVVQSTPKKGVETQYSKAIIWVRKEDFSIAKTELYDMEGELLKVIENESRKVKEKYIIPFNTFVRNVRTGDETQMIVESIEVEIDIPSRYFSESFLGKW